MSAKSERRERIVAMLGRAGRLAAGRLAAELGVTEMTIRRDLAAMERSGLLARTHGGCVLRSLFASELTFDEKDGLGRAEKAAIAAAVVRLIKRGESVYLDTGTTAVHVARVLPVGLALRVFTNNLRVAMELFGRDGVEVIVYGGRLARSSPDLISEIAVERASCFSVDMAVVGADALDPEKGEYFSADLGTAMLSRAVQARAGRVVVAVDSSKFGIRARYLVGRLGTGMTLVTNTGIGACVRSLARRSGAHIILAGPCDT